MTIASTTRAVDSVQLPAVADYGHDIELGVDVDCRHEPGPHGSERSARAVSCFDTLAELILQEVGSTCCPYTTAGRSWRPLASRCRAEPLLGGGVPEESLDAVAST